MQTAIPLTIDIPVKTTWQLATPNKEVKKNTLRKRLFLRGMLICVRVYSFCLVNSKFYQQITIAFHFPLCYGKRSIV